MSENLPGEAASGQPPSVWQVMYPVRGKIALAMAWSVISALCGMLSLAMLAWSVGKLMQSGSPWWPLLWALILAVVASVLRLHAFNQSHYAAFRLESILRTDLCAHVARLPLGVVEAIGSSSLAKVIQDDVKALHVFVADSTPMVARACITPFATLIALAYLDWRLMLAACAVLAIGFSMMRPAMRDHAKMSALVNLARERVAAAVTEFVQAMPVVRNFDTGYTTFSRFQRALNAYREVVVGWSRSVGFTARFSLALLNPLPTLMVLTGLGALLMQDGDLSLHRWIAVLLLGTGMAESILPLMSLYQMLEKSKISVRRIQQVMLMPPMQKMESDVSTTSPVSCSPSSAVVFENVCFRYAGQHEDALNNISFHAMQGRVTALVGTSGAGKSTVARLIPRFHDVTSGRILVNGVDIRTMEHDTLMAQVAFVFQDNFLFSGSIADNIRLGVPGASDEQVVAAASAAQAHDFIAALPQGYATPAGERGVFLSGGERQRIAIARALLLDRPILVLDEVTAFADAENEAALVRALSQLMQGRTVIMIAHRLSATCNADQILVFDEGRLAECGNHEALLGKQGAYTRLWGNFMLAQRWTLRTGLTDTPSLESE